MMLVRGRQVSVTLGQANDSSGIASVVPRCDLSPHFDCSRREAACLGVSCLRFGA
jgi:hypothetical protein